MDKGMKISVKLELDKIRTGTVVRVVRGSGECKFIWDDDDSSLFPSNIQQLKALTYTCPADGSPSRNSDWATTVIVLPCQAPLPFKFNRTPYEFFLNLIEVGISVSDLSVDDAGVKAVLLKLCKASKKKVDFPGCLPIPFLLIHSFRSAKLVSATE
jgi:hypothetical protein